MVGRLRLPDAWAAIEHFFQQPCSDGLPVVPPIEALVGQMPDTVERRPEEVVGLVAPRFGEATGESSCPRGVGRGCVPIFPIRLPAKHGVK